MRKTLLLQHGKEEQTFPYFLPNDNLTIMLLEIKLAELKSALCIRCRLCIFCQVCV